MRVYLKYIFLICFLFTNCFSQEQDSSLEDIILIVKGYSEHSYNNVMSYWRELYNVPTNSDKNILKIVVKSFDAVPNEENCKLLLSTLMNIFVAHFVEHVDERNCNEDYYIFLGNETLQEFAKCFELGNRSLKKQSENKKKYTLIGCAVFGVVIIGWLFVKAKGKWKKTITENKLLKERLELEGSAYEKLGRVEGERIEGLESEVREKERNIREQQEELDGVEQRAREFGEEYQEATELVDQYRAMRLQALGFNPGKLATKIAAKVIPWGGLIFGTAEMLTESQKKKAEKEIIDRLVMPEFSVGG